MFALRKTVTIRYRSQPQITWKHAWPVDQIRDALVESQFFKLPNEVLFQIFQLLSISDLGNVSLVCRLFKTIASDDKIWQAKCNTPHKLLSNSFKEIYMDWTYEKYLQDTYINSHYEYMLFYDCLSLSDCKCNFRELFPLSTTAVRSVPKIQTSSVAGFKQHPNSSQDMVIHLTFDIDRTVRLLISLLEKTSKFQLNWYQPTIVKQMILRYYRFMQLKACLPNNILLVPTLDIEIVWQTHLLRPEMYRNDCLRLFRRIIEHSLHTDTMGQFLKKQAFYDTCRLYEQRFGEQYCPRPVTKTEREERLRCPRRHVGATDYCTFYYSYWDETHFEFTVEPLMEYENPFSFTESDVISDSNWLTLCKNFMFETSANVELYRRNPQDTTHLAPPELQLLKKSYERFLYLAAKYPFRNENELLHGTYAIDIIRHAHMQRPLNYASDCLRFVGYVIDHIPLSSVEAYQMEPSYVNFSGIWRKEFHHNIATDHLYRFPIPAIELIPDTMEEVD